MFYVNIVLLFHNFKRRNRLVDSYRMLWIYREMEKVKEVPSLKRNFKRALFSNVERLRFRSKRIFFFLKSTLRKGGQNIIQIAVCRANRSVKVVGE